ncbi:MAG: glucose-1-phosphate adenylyltransferase [Fuerstiella sp.]
MSLLSDTITIVLAGGAGSRLAPLTTDRAKPAVPFGGQYRIIDFTLSNCLNSGLRQILVLTQYKSHSLHRHLHDAWEILNPELGEYITSVPPQLRTGGSWYQGTADAIYQNLCLLQSSGAEDVLILAGDHVYQMDYAQLLRRHRHSAADVTVACTEVSLQEARSFGVMSIDEQQRIRRFDEKPANPNGIPDSPDKALASMGIYVFSLDVLCRELQLDSQDPASSHDFGKDVLPNMVRTHRVSAFRYRAPDESMTAYWRDVGTIDTYYQANMDLLEDSPPLDLYSNAWPIRKYERPAPPARVQRDRFGVNGTITESMLSNGVMISGGAVSHSALSPNVHVDSAAVVEDSILFDDVHIGPGARVRNCIIDKGVSVPAGETIGIDAAADRKRFTLSKNGVIVVPRKYRFQPRVPHLTHQLTPPEMIRQRSLTETF